MRLLKTMQDPVKAQSFSAFLTSQGIENQLDIINDTTTATPSVKCRLWIIYEDMQEKASQLLNDFQNNPSHQAILPKPQLQDSQLQSKVQGSSETSRGTLPDEIIDSNGIGDKDLHQKGPRVAKATAGPAISTTFYLIIICSILFLIDTMTGPKLKPTVNLPMVPQLSSQLKKNTLYDYPMSYELTDNLISVYGIEKLKNPSTLPEDGQILYTKIHKTPIWHGAYALIKDHLSHQKASHHKSYDEKVMTTQYPTFDKIKEGEVWRLFTPAVMHHDILHLLFNMLWLVVLGQQMEQRLGSLRYVCFAFVIAIFSNTSQYLMSGGDFLGFSGVIAGMLAFIWMRQKVAAWEGYPLPRSTINFIFFFIVAMLLVQVISFFLEVSQGIAISAGIANTAHISGAILGALLARSSLFAWKI